MLSQLTFLCLCKYSILCAVQKNSYYPHVVTEHFSVAGVTEDKNFRLPLINLNVNSSIWLVTVILDSERR